MCQVKVQLAKPVTAQRGKIEAVVLLFASNDTVSISVYSVERECYGATSASAPCAVTMPEALNPSEEIQIQTALYKSTFTYLVNYSAVVS